MAMKNPYGKYKEQAVNFSSPEKLLLMLFDGAIKFSGQARLAINKQDYEQANNLIHKCENIMNYLINTLDPKYPISADIEKMYDYILYNFIQANVSKDEKYLDQADIYLREYRDTWEQAAKIAREEKVKMKAAF